MPIYPEHIQTAVVRRRLIEMLTEADEATINNFLNTKSTLRDMTPLLLEKAFFETFPKNSPFTHAISLAELKGAVASIEVQNESFFLTITAHFANGSQQLLGKAPTGFIAKQMLATSLSDDIPVKWNAQDLYLPYQDANSPERRCVPVFAASREEAVAKCQGWDEWNTGKPAHISSYLSDFWVLINWHDLSTSSLHASGKHVFDLAGLNFDVGQVDPQAVSAFRDLLLFNKAVCKNAF